MKILFLFLLVTSQLAAQTQNIKVATFDSGFGGFFTAKEIEYSARKLTETYDVQFSITHYGDTRNAPYGEKQPEQIARLAASGISRAFKDGAEQVFIACNTASTQFAAIKALLEAERPGLSSNIVSIIESSVQELKQRVDAKLASQNKVRVMLLATPFTVKSMTYPKALAQAYGLPEPITNLTSHAEARWYTQKGKSIDNVVSFNVLKLPQGKQIEVYQLGPGNWVDMIEHGAPAEVQRKAVEQNLKLVNTQLPFDVVGEFCTHFPVFDEFIKTVSLKNGLARADTHYIKQGPLMAGIFQRQVEARLRPAARKLDPATKAKLTEITRPIIYLSGSNIEETRQLSQQVFPQDPIPLIKQQDF
jgi:glutamate racemase